MASYVLVHGGTVSTETWNKLTNRNDYPPGGHLGGKAWKPVIPALQAHGHQVFAPDLRDEHSCNLTGHVTQICDLLTANNLDKVVLTGHSYGGMVITGVAARMPKRIGQLVYIDAALPDPGQSLFDLIAGTGIDPLSFAGLEAASAYVEKLQFDPEKIKALPKTYILCRQSEFSSVTSIARKKIAAPKNLWNYIELHSSHVPMASAPEKLASLLLACAQCSTCQLTS